MHSVLYSGGRVSQTGPSCALWEVSEPPLVQVLIVHSHRSTRTAPKIACLQRIVSGLRLREPAGVSPPCSVPQGAGCCWRAAPHCSRFSPLSNRPALLQADEVAWPLSLPKGVGACWEVHTIFLFFSGLVLRTKQLRQPAFSPGDPHHPPRGSQPFLIAPFHEVLSLWL